MRAVALLLSITLSLPAAGCFPNNARYRTYAKIGEGASLAAGITLLLATRTTGADCAATPSRPYAECRDDASRVSAVGLGLILAGLVGFVATISTTPDDKPTTTTPSSPAPTPTPVAPVPIAPASAPAPMPIAAPPLPPSAPPAS